MRVKTIAFMVLALAGCDDACDDDLPAPPLPLVPERRILEGPGTWALVAAPGGFDTGSSPNCSELTPVNGERWYSCLFPQSSAVNTIPIRFYDSTRCQRQNWRPRLVEPNPNVLLQEREPGQGCQRTGWELRLLRR